MRRFGLVLDDHLYNSFYSRFPDYGQRTSLLRRCVHRLIQKAHENGGVLPKDIDEIVDEAYKKEMGDY